MQIEASLEQRLREILKTAGFGGLESILRARDTTALPAQDHARLLHRLLESLDCTAESVAALRMLISSSPVAGQALDEKDVADSTHLARLMKRFSPEELRSLPSSIRNISPDEPGIEVLQPEVRAALLTFIEIRQEENHETGRISAPLLKLCEALRKIPGCALLLDRGDKVLEEALKAHLETFRQAESGLHEAVNRIFTENPLGSLVATLDRAIETLREPKSEIEARFLAFITQLRRDLSSAVSDDLLRMTLETALQTIEREFKDTAEGLPRKTHVLLRSIEAQITAMLQIPEEDLTSFPHALEALRDLMVELRSTPLRGEFKEHVERMEQQLLKAMQQQDPREPLRALRIMAAQATSSFEAPPDIIQLERILKTTLELSVDGKHFAELMRNWKLQSVSVKLPGEAGMALQNFSKDIDEGKIQSPEALKKRLEELVPVMRSVAAEKGDPHVSELLNQIEEEIHRVLAVLDGSTENQPQAPETGAARRELSEYRRQELLQHTRQMPAGAEHNELRAALMKDPAVLLALRVLKSADWSLFQSSNPLERDFLEFLKEISARVPLRPAMRGENGNGHAVLRRELDEAFSKLEQQFRAEHPSGDPRAVEMHRMVNAVEQMLKGHELLERLNPLMNLLGEPAFLIFPTIIHGFASQIELIAWPTPPDEEAGEDEHPNGEKRASQRYKHFELDMRFKGMGRVQSRVAFRDGEFLLELVTENDAVASFLQHRLVRFEGLLRSLGFQRTELRASSATQEPMRPEWLPVLSKLFERAA